MPLRHAGSAFAAPAALMPSYAQPALLVGGAFQPADAVAARRLSQSDQALVLVWPSAGHPEVESFVFTCDLAGEFTLELPGDTYDIAAYVMDESRDDFRGTAEIGYLQLPWSTDTELVLAVTASDAEWISDQLVGEFGDTLAELVLPDGIRVPLAEHTTIGRGEDCNLQLPDWNVSTHHAYIGFVTDHYRIEDLQSLNGTYLNNQLIAGSWPLQHGDLVNIAGWEMEFRFR
jgi:hypothetical protein